MRLALHVHYRLFSVTSEESLRDSEPPHNGYPSTQGLGQRTSVCESCTCVIHANTHIRILHCLCGVHVLCEALVIFHFVCA